MTYVKEVSNKSTTPLELSGPLNSQVVTNTLYMTIILTLQINI